MLFNYCTNNVPLNFSKAFGVTIKLKLINFKFSIQVPLGVKQAPNLDQKNVNALWRKYIKRGDQSDGQLQGTLGHPAKSIN